MKKLFLSTHSAEHHKDRLPMGSAKKPAWLFPLILLFLVVMPGSALAGSITVGVPKSQNCFPFSCPGHVGLTEYQQVYTASAFSNTPFSISSFSLAVEAFPFGQAIDTATYDIFLSTTSRVPSPLSVPPGMPRSDNGLSTDLSTNLGSNTQFFGEFQLSGSIAGELSFAGVPYSYDPSQGNLLLDVKVSGISLSHENDSSVIAFFKTDYTGAVTSRAYNATTAEFEANGEGLVTTFNSPSTGVPEPGNFALLGFGVLALVARRRSGRRE